MTSPYPSPVHTAAIVLAAVLAACSTPPGNYRDDAPHEELLQTLRQCLVEVAISGESNKDFVSPCIVRDVSSLNGIPRHRLIDALGPARLCLSQNDISFPEKENCPFNLNPVWSFYRHPDSIDTGGGPQLICVANNQMHCTTVEWRRTK